ncbi:protein FATTY ACID EXPORT 4, chloroplastic [Humulus lupulus]|uniref:protein FATTY ACID EXPORT 4, chloroplastic n=1 Tax=Humulus lupulus TaxID=3486 RepID=UPI002B40E29E|nr:protein FATTY ACID EXPORT 4, chloroplastic [Humulus lupulus]XP_062074774.1 protein FATTY ACID EXPORT 4, chloroplastic [Humulus lupulus]
MMMPCCAYLSSSSSSVVLLLGHHNTSFSSRVDHYRQQQLLIKTRSPCRGHRNASVVCSSNYQQLLADVAPSTSALYGLLLSSGGLYAFTKSGSKGSLFGGLTGGALMAAVYILMQSPESRSIGDALGFGSAFLFSSVFGIRLAATRKLIPAGPLLGVSLCALLIFVSAYLQDVTPPT